MDSAFQLDLPEAKLPLAEPNRLPPSPKSNSAYLGINKAMSDVKAGKAGPIRESFKMYMPTAPALSGSRATSTLTTLKPLG